MKKAELSQLVKEALQTYVVTRDNERDIEKELKTDVKPGDKITAEDLDIGHIDDEPGMLKQEVYDIIQYAVKLYKLLKHYEDVPGEVDFPHWWQAKIVKARAMISKAQHYLDFETKEPQIDQEVGIQEIQADSPELYSTKDLLQAIKDLSKIRSQAAANNQEILVQIANRDIERIHRVLKRRKDSEDRLDSMQNESRDITDVKKGDTIVHDTENKRYQVQGIISKDKLKVVDAKGNVRVVNPYHYHIEELVNEGAEEVMNAYNDVLDLVKKHSRNLSDDDSYAFGLKLKAWFKKNILDEATEEEEDEFHRKLDKLVHKTFGHSSDEKKKVEEDDSDQSWVDQAIKDYEEMKANSRTRNDDDLEAGIK